MPSMKKDRVILRRKDGSGSGVILSRADVERFREQREDADDYEEVSATQVKADQEQANRQSAADRMRVTRKAVAADDADTEDKAVSEPKRARG